jgi:catechol 2,3-dioxygenase-like lactoylglutathione lyase family enzyme
MKNSRLLHYSHCVSDIERSRRFYTDVLGFEIVAADGYHSAGTPKGWTG